jgi:hypothetical protein
MVQTIFAGTLLSDAGVLNGLQDFQELVFKGILDLKEIHNLDELKTLATRKSRVKSRALLEGFRKSNGLLSAADQLSLGA